MASMALDTDETDASVFVSDTTDTSPWWIMDLGMTKMIYDIQIQSRRDLWPEMFHDIEVSSN